MLIMLQQLAAAIYLLAAIVGGVALSSAGPARRAAAWLLSAGAVVHLAAFGFLHSAEPTPHLTDLPAVISLMSCLAMVAFLAFTMRARWDALVVWIAPLGFLGAFFGAARMPHAPGTSIVDAGSWPHAHVLLASAGLGLLAVAGLAGVAFLREARALKRKRTGATGLPSLETLDRVNVVSLSVGFVLLTLGVLTGMLWLEASDGALWSGSAHEIWTTVAWAIYGGLLLGRFAMHQSARSAALSAVGGFGFLLFAVLGVGWLA